MIEIMHLHKIPGIQMRLNWYVKYGKILINTLVELSSTSVTELWS